MTNSLTSDSHSAPARYPRQPRREGDGGGDAQRLAELCEHKRNSEVACARRNGSHGTIKTGGKGPQRVRVDGICHMACRLERVAYGECIGLQRHEKGADRGQPDARIRGDADLAV